MKLYPYCAACMLRRCSHTMDIVSKDRALKMRALKELFRFLSEHFDEKGNPSDIGTEETHFIARMLGVKDPFKDLKLRAIERAKSIIPRFLSKIPPSGKERWRYLFLLAICANKIEISAPHVHVNLERLEHEIEECISLGFGIDHTEEIIRKIHQASRILYICDNAGEAPFDLLLINELEKYTDVLVGVCNEPVDDDLTFAEVSAVGMERKKLIGKGRGFGVLPRYATPEILEEMKRVDLVIAKGMANYETLTELDFLKGKRALLFKVKCPSVAEDCGAKVGENAALLI